MAKKILTLVLATLVSFSALSATKEEAEALFASRGLTGEARTYSKQAAKIVMGLVASRSTVLEKAELLTLASKFYYFDAFIMPDKPKKAKMKVYWKGYVAGLKAVNLLGDNAGDAKSAVNPTKPEYTEQIAAAMAWLGSNIGRWGKLKGVFSALGKWRKILKPRIEDMFRLDADTEGFIAYRIAGGALNTLGGTINFAGTEKNALELMTEAYDLSQVDYEIETSDSMATNIFYLDALRKAGKVDKFCEVYDNINDIFAEASEDSSVLDIFAPFAPEAPIEYKVNFKGEKAFHKYYSKECE